MGRILKVTSLTLRVAHLSDTHSQIHPHKCVTKNIAGTFSLHAGGYPLLISAIRGLREQAKGTDFLTLHSGDSFQGSAHFQKYPGQLNAKLLNLLEIDAMVVGNHEFDMGFDVFAKFCAASKFPILAHNMSAASLFAEEKRSLAQGCIFFDEGPSSPVLLRTMQGGKSLAIIGLTLENLPDLANCGSRLTFSDPIITAQRLVNKLHGQGIYHVFVLSHLGEELDEELAHAVPDISAIFGGHTHRLYGKDDMLDSGKSRPCGFRVEDVPLFHCGANGQYFGSYTLVLDAKGRSLEAHGETYSPFDATDLFAEKILELGLEERTGDLIPTHPAIDVCELLEKDFPIAHSHPLDPLVVNAAIPHERVPTDGKTSQLARAVAQAILKQLHEVKVPADLALLNAGVLRAGIDPGTYPNPSDLFTRIIPFDLDIVVVRIPGKVLQRGLSRAMLTAQQPSKNGCYPHYSFGHSDISAIKANEEYDVAMTSYVANGKDGYFEFADSNLPRINSGLKLREVCELNFLDFARSLSSPNLENSECLNSQ